MDWKINAALKNQLNIKYNRKRSNRHQISQRKVKTHQYHQIGTTQIGANQIETNQIGTSQKEFEKGEWVNFTPKTQQQNSISKQASQSIGSSFRDASMQDLQRQQVYNVQIARQKQLLRSVSSFSKKKYNQRDFQNLSREAQLKMLDISLQNLRKTYNQTEKQEIQIIKSMQMQIEDLKRKHYSL